MGDSRLVLGATPEQASVTLNVGDRLVIADDGGVYNAHGTLLFRLERLGTPVRFPEHVQPLRTLEADVPIDPSKP